MKWYSESRESWIARVEKWHSWFAWHPVRIGERKVWLETIERLGTVHFSIYEHPMVTFEYRLLGEEKS